jgi:hypothetical protein
MSDRTRVRSFMDGRPWIQNPLNLFNLRLNVLSNRNYYTQVQYILYKRIFFTRGRLKMDSGGENSGSPAKLSSSDQIPNTFVHTHGIKIIEISALQILI